MDFSISTEQQALVRAFGEYLDGLDLNALYQERAEDPHDIRAAGKAFLRRLGRDGWLAVGWPREFGGKGLSAVEQWLVLEELAYRRLPANRVSLLSVGPVIMRFGSAEQKAALLPAIISGDVWFALGYSEPNAGSDLASLQTRAVGDGDDYRITGQKIYTSAAHNATHIWLAVRTDAGAAKHHGISLLVVPVHAPGITVRPLYTQGDTRTNEVFFDDVRVSKKALVGTENSGWEIVTAALSFERIFEFGKEARLLDDLARWALGADGTDDAQQLALARLLVDVEIARLFALRNVRIIDSGRVPIVESSICKIWISELGQRIASVGLGLMGDAGQIGVGMAGAPAEGELERAYRASPMFKFAGGTNEIQRNIVAQRGLGLPRPS